MKSPINSDIKVDDIVRHGSDIARVTCVYDGYCRIQYTESGMRRSVVNEKLTLVRRANENTPVKVNS